MHHRREPQLHADIELVRLVMDCVNHALDASSLLRFYCHDHSHVVNTHQRHHRWQRAAIQYITSVTSPAFRRDMSIIDWMSFLLDVPGEVCWTLTLSYSLYYEYVADVEKRMRKEYSYWWIQRQGSGDLHHSSAIVRTFHVAVRCVWQLSSCYSPGRVEPNSEFASTTPR